MKFDLKKLSEIAKPRSQASIERERFNIENREWILRSQEIAISILYYLHENSISQVELAKQMGVTAPYIAKILRGNENLTLETICKIEKALKKPLISVHKPYGCRMTMMPMSKIDSLNFEKGPSITIRQGLENVTYTSNINNRVA